MFRAECSLEASFLLPAFLDNSTLSSRTIACRLASSTFTFPSSSTLNLPRPLQICADCRLCPTVHWPTRREACGRHSQGPVIFRGETLPDNTSLFFVLVVRSSLELHIPQPRIGLHLAVIIAHEHTLTAVNPTEIFLSGRQLTLRARTLWSDHPRTHNIRATFTLCEPHALNCQSKGMLYNFFHACLEYCELFLMPHCCHATGRLSWARRHNFSFNYQTIMFP